MVVDFFESDPEHNAVVGPDKVVGGGFPLPPLPVQTSGEEAQKPTQNLSSQRTIDDEGYDDDAFLLGEKGHGKKPFLGTSKKGIGAWGRYTRSI